MEHSEVALAAPGRAALGIDEHVEVEAPRADAGRLVHLVEVVRGLRVKSVGPAGRRRRTTLTDDEGLAGRHGGITPGVDVGEVADAGVVAALLEARLQAAPCVVVHRAVVYE